MKAGPCRSRSPTCDRDHGCGIVLLETMQRRIKTTFRVSGLCGLDGDTIRPLAPILDTVLARETKFRRTLSTTRIARARDLDRSDGERHAEDLLCETDAVIRHSKLRCRHAMLVTGTWDRLVSTVETVAERLGSCQVGLHRNDAPSHCPVTIRIWGSVHPMEGRGPRRPSDAAGTISRGRGLPPRAAAPNRGHGSPVAHGPAHRMTYNPSLFHRLGATGGTVPVHA